MFYRKKIKRKFSSFNYFKCSMFDWLYLIIPTSK